MYQCGKHDLKLGRGLRLLFSNMEKICIQDRIFKDFVAIEFKTKMTSLLTGLQMYHTFDLLTTVTSCDI